MVQVSNQQPKVWIDGQYVPANKGQDGKWYVEIDGKRVAVDPNDLFGINSNLTDVPEYFVNYYEKSLAKKEEKAEYLKTAEKVISDKMKGVTSLYENLLAKFNVKKYDEIDSLSAQTEAKEFYQSLSDLRRAKVRNSNDQYSNYMSMFNDALDQGEWQNQLNLAQHVMDSLG